MADVKISFLNSRKRLGHALLSAVLSALLISVFAEPLSAQSRSRSPGNWNAQVRTPWQTSCRTITIRGKRLEACTTKYSQRDRRNRRILAAVTLRTVQGRGDVTLRVTLPSGLARNRGVQARIDNDSKVIRLKITNCGRSGCIASARLNRAQLGRFRSGQTLQFLAVGQRGNPVVVTVPLIGFPKSFGAPAPRPATIARAQRKRAVPKAAAPRVMRRAPAAKTAPGFGQQASKKKKSYSMRRAPTKKQAAPPGRKTMAAAPPPVAMKKSAPLPLVRRKPPPPASAPMTAPPPSAEREAAPDRSRTRAFQGPREVPPDEPFAVVKVYYATDRQPTGGGDPAERYGVDRGPVSYGICTVSIPRDHRLGELEAPSIWRLEFSEDPEKHVVLLSISEQRKSVFFDDVRNAVKNSADKAAFVFVHGYNVSFEDAARRTAQMSYDLGFDGAPVFYSWPSQAQVAAYTVDETNVAWSQTNLKEFLRDFAEQSDAENIFLIGHSMGTRALTGALKDLFVEYPEIRPRLKEIILAAPDIDADIFRRDIAPRITTANRSITLYASSNDTALIASKRFHGYRRAGDTSGGVMIVDGVDTIDSTDVDTGFLGHAYYAEAKSIVTDIFNLMRYGKPPRERQGLAPVPSAAGQYWRFLTGKDKSP